MIMQVVTLKYKGVVIKASWFEFHEFKGGIKLKISVIMVYTSTRYHVITYRKSHPFEMLKLLLRLVLTPWLYQLSYGNNN